MSKCRGGRLSTRTGVAMRLRWQLQMQRGQPEGTPDGNPLCMFKERGSCLRKCSTLRRRECPGVAPVLSQEGGWTDKLTICRQVALMSLRMPTCLRRGVRAYLYVMPGYAAHFVHYFGPIGPLLFKKFFIKQAVFGKCSETPPA